MSPIDFLFKIWSRVCQEGDYVFLSTKDKGWRDHGFLFDKSIKGKVRDFLRTHDPKKEDIYFCPLPFSKNRRLAANVKPVNLLWSDLDDGDEKKIRPTVLWESSPGRHHALWFIDDRLNAEDAARINRSITYKIGADKGGWDLSQVLRIPGTFNHKYQSLPEVKLLHWDDKEYSVSGITQKAGHKEEVKVEITDQLVDVSDILSSYRLSSKVLSLLQEEPEEGRRSDVIWYLENKLHEVGMSPDEIIAVIKASSWNKYKGRGDEDERLRTELSKVIEKDIEVKKKKKEKAQGMRIETFSQVMSNLQSTPGWTVPGFWMRKSHGIVAGEPKSFKSTLVMDLALSIASDTPFLGKYPVENPGSVVYIQNENAHWIMKDRFEKMTNSKGLVGEVKKRGNNKLTVRFPQELPFYMINQQGFMLTDEFHQEFLEETIVKLKPELIILDPLYLMFDGDIASAQELFPILQWLLELKNDLNTGVMMIHHWNKGGDSKRGGQRMLGSTTLHGWVESAWYVGVGAETEEGRASLVMDREFRGAGIHEKLDIDLTMGEMNDPRYEVNVGHHSSSDIKGANPERVLVEVERVLSQRRSMSEKLLSDNTGYPEHQVRVAVDTLISSRKAYRKAGSVHYDLG